MGNLTHINYNEDGGSVIELVCMGDELIPENIIDTWRAQKSNYSKLENTQLKIVQGGRDDSEEKFNYVSELYESKKAELLNKDERIRLLEEELSGLSRLVASQIPFQEISAEAKVNYDYLESLGFSRTITTDFSKVDTVPIFEVKWKDISNQGKVEEDTKKLNNWLKLRLKDSTIQVK